MRYLMIIFCGAMTALLAGCGQEAAPDPPTAYSQLVTGLFDDMLKSKHQAAAEKAAKLRALEPESAFLTQLEENEQSNYYIKLAQNEIDKGNVAAAIKIVDAGQKKYPFNTNLSETKNILVLLFSLQKKIISMRTPVSSDALLADIAEANSIIKNLPAAARLKPIIADKTKQAARMALRENKRARISLLCDILSTRKEDPKLAEVMSTQFELENNLKANRGNRIDPALLKKNKR